jgi:hypothetical protein
MSPVALVTLLIRFALVLSLMVAGIGKASSVTLSQGWAPWFLWRFPKPRLFQLIAALEVALALLLAMLPTRNVYLSVAAFGVAASLWGVASIKATGSCGCAGTTERTTIPRLAVRNSAFLAGAGVLIAMNAQGGAALGILIVLGGLVGAFAYVGLREREQIHGTVGSVELSA